MSRSLSAPPASTGTELETVVNWPLLAGAAGVAVVLLAVPLTLACVAALKGHAVKDPVAALPAAPQPKPVKVTPATTPTPAPLPPSVKQEAKGRSVPRQVYIKNVQPTIPPDPTPIPKRAKTPPAPPPERNPILQVREGPSYKRLVKSSEDYLIALLYETIQEVDLESVEGTREKVLAEAREAGKDKGEKKPTILALRAERPDLKGLPMREGADCQVRPDALRKIQEISTTLRRELDRPALRRDPDRRTSGLSASGELSSARAALLQMRLRSSEKWFQEDGISTLAQMLQVEDEGSRGEFVKRLAGVEGLTASVLLARQALFDLSWTIREDAIKALQDRPREQYRRVLLDALRYPWQPVAAHAAEALVALNDRAAVFSLADMLDQPDPCAPVRDRSDKWVVAEVVKINHFRNCLLCHAPSTDVKDPLRAAVPTPGQPLPTFYYGRGKGDFVRADITYLRQDFSQMERVAKPDKWPQWQRFDYVVRTRELTAEEVAAHERKLKGKPAAHFYFYPQRKAVLFALRELTGLNAGETRADWYQSLCFGDTAAD